MRTSERRRAGPLAALGGAAVVGLSAVAVSCSDGGGGAGSGMAVSGGASASPTPSPTPTASSTLPATVAVACAPYGAVAFASNCTLELASDGTSKIAVVRHADGGFRRFAVRDDGGVEEADGAVKAVVVRTGDTLDVTVGADRYRLSAAQLAR